MNNANSTKASYTHPKPANSNRGNGLCGVPRKIRLHQISRFQNISASERALCSRQSLFVQRLVQNSKDTREKSQTLTCDTPATKQEREEGKRLTQVDVCEPLCVDGVRRVLVDVLQAQAGQLRLIKKPCLATKQQSRIQKVFRSLH